MYDGAPGNRHCCALVLRIAVVEMPLPPRLLRVRMGYHYPQRCASEERASEGRGVLPPGGPRTPGRRPTLLRALCGRDVELLSL